jgi:signal transduction histidine kinase
VGYGLPAAATVLLYRAEGALGIVSILATAAVLQGFLVFFARRLHAHNEETAAHQKEREALLQRAIHASDGERQRIAGELHDGVVQDLAGVSITMSAAARARADMSPREQELAGMLRASADTIRTASGDLRTLIIELAPPTLRDEGLAVALADLTARVERTGMILRLTISPELDLSEVQSKLIYRVCLESVRNAIKYARGSLVTVTVKRVGSDVVTTISDDGVGFTEENRAERRTQGHVGLGLLTETAKDGGGALFIESQPGHGTVVVLNLPAASD